MLGCSRTVLGVPICRYMTPEPPDAATVSGSSPDDVSKPARASDFDPVRAASLLRDESKAAASESAQRWRAIAVGSASGLMVSLMVVVWYFGNRGPALPKTGQRSAVLPSVMDATIPNALPTVPKPVATPVPPPVSRAGISRASIQASDRNWITACAAGKVVFSKLFTAGSEDSVDFTSQAVVRMGNAGPVELLLNGKSVGSLGQMGQVRVIALTPTASHFLAGGEPDDCTLGR